MNHVYEILFHRRGAEGAEIILWYARRSGFSREFCFACPDCYSRLKPLLQKIILCALRASAVNKGLCKHHPGGRYVLNAFFYRDCPVFMRPERREQHEFAGFGFYLEVLVKKFCFTARTGYIIEIPQGD